MITTTLIDKKKHNHSIRWNNLILILSSIGFGVWMTKTDILMNDILSAVFGAVILVSLIVNAVWMAKRSQSFIGTLIFDDNAITIENKKKKVIKRYFLNDIGNISVRYIDHLPGDGSYRANFRYMLGLTRYPTLSFYDLQGKVFSYTFEIESYYMLHQIQKWAEKHTAPEALQTTEVSSIV